VLKIWTTFKYRLELWPPDVSKWELNVGIQTLQQYALDTYAEKQLAYAATDV
jgi:hypothetical protein